MKIYEIFVKIINVGKNQTHVAYKMPTQVWQRERARRAAGLAAHTGSATSTWRTRVPGSGGHVGLNSNPTHRDVNGGPPRGWAYISVGGTAGSLGPLSGWPPERLLGTLLRRLQVKVEAGMDWGHETRADTD